jgi:hypothetical protein
MTTSKGVWATMEEGSATRLLGGEVIGVEPGWRSGGRRLIARGRDGGGDDGEASGGVSEAREGRR